MKYKALKFIIISYSQGLKRVGYTFLTGIVFLLFFLTTSLFGQAVNEKTLSKEHNLNIRELEVTNEISAFLDCSSCDNSYIRQEINFVNYVRDPQLAQVHIFITNQSSGSGGKTFTISFIGKKEFEGINNSLTFNSFLTNTQDEERQGLNAKIKIGLVSYIAHTSQADQLTLTFTDLQVEQKHVHDPWNNWIFELYGGINFEKETSIGSLDIRYGVYADHISEKWRIRMRPFFNYNQRNFISDGKKYRSILHRNGFEGRTVRSISDHWSAGVFTNIISSTYDNIQFGYSVAPAIEYSLLPYREALRKEITLAYSVGYLQRKYMEETIYGKDNESLMNQALTLGVRVRQPWGSVTAELEGSHFLHDPAKNRLSFESNVSVRIFKGLAVNFSSEFGIVRDQLALPKGNASLEDMLLQQRQIATSYGISLSVGLTYSFGSMYNNIINTRL